MNKSSFLDFLRERNISFTDDKSIKSISHIKIGGECIAIVYPKNENELINIVDFAIILKLKYKIIGRMTNILPSDDFYDGIIISTKRLSGYDVKGKIVSCGCGVVFSALISKLALSGVGGAEQLALIPGTMGGMLYNNAGAYGKEISEYVLSVRVYNPLFKKIINLDKTEVQFGYRESIFKKGLYIILSAELEFNEKSLSDIKLDLLNFKSKRGIQQPTSSLSLGSIFKRVEDISAGYYIDKCGLKGLSVGDAIVSEKHAGFIVNKKSATANDYKALIQLIKNTVKERYGIILEEEIEYL